MSRRAEGQISLLKRTRYDTSGAENSAVLPKHYGAEDSVRRL